MDRSGHDSDFTLSRRDHPRAIRPYQPDPLSSDKIDGADHVGHRNPFGDGNNQRNLCSCSFHYRISSKRRRNKDHTRIGPGSIYSFLDGIENRDSFKILTAFSGGDTGNDVGSIIPATTGVELSLGSGDPLNQQFSIIVDQNSHETSFRKLMIVIE